MKRIKAADLFCGAGGTSTGLVDAATDLGYAVDLTAINHWDIAIATHTANHPGARHRCASLDSINPRDLYGEGELDLMWASPECTHHSTARGGKPVNDQSRATAWCVCRWAEALMPRIILIENVPEFQSWGPLIKRRQKVKVKVPTVSYRKWKKRQHDDRSRAQWKKSVKWVKKEVMRDTFVPDPKHKGELFQAWVTTLRAMGYKVDWRTLVCADYGDPTTRERLFVYCVRGKRKVVWPEKTHASVAETDLFGKKFLQWEPFRNHIDWSDRGKSIYKRKRPLSPTTMERIMIGLQKFGLAEFLVQPGHGNNCATANNCRATDLNKPLGTQPGSNRFAVVSPFLVGAGGPTGGGEPQSVDKPIGSVMCRNTKAVVTPELKPFMLGQQSGAQPRSVDNPAPTVAAAGAISLIEPRLIKLKGSSKSHIKASSQSLDKPAPAVCGSGGHFGIAQAALIEVNHGNGDDPKGNERRVHSVDKPVKTVTGTLGTGLAQFILSTDHTGGNGVPVRSVNDPLSSVTTKQRHALIDPYLVKYNGTGGARSVNDPLDTVTTKERFGLAQPVLEINGEKYVLDILFRMLKVQEIAAAQSFKPDYKFTGKTKDIVKQIGNAVPRKTARALALAALSQDPNIVRKLEKLDK